jgi:serine/threonine protein phosphatase 1
MRTGPVLAAFRRMFGQTPAGEPLAYPGLEGGQVVYAVGDIHGRADLLAMVFEAIDHDIAHDDAAGHGARDIVEIYLGDYVDRGPQSRLVIDMLIERRHDHHAVCIAGNHEAVFFGLLRGEGAYADWAPLGGRETVLSYGLTPGDLAAMAPAEQLAALTAAVPEDHRRFFASLVLNRVVGPYTFVHAGIRPGVPIEEQSARDLMWIRRDFIDKDVALDTIVVHGHTPMPEPDFRPYRINIDTGAYASGRLTCLKIDAEGPLVLLTTGAPTG